MDKVGHRAVGPNLNLLAGLLGQQIAINPMVSHARRKSPHDGFRVGLPGELDRV
jgi:hypothetical protein